MCTRVPVHANSKKRRMQKSACPAVRRNVMSLRNDRYPRLTSETTRKGKSADKHARNSYPRMQEYVRARARARENVYRDN